MSFPRAFLRKRTTDGKPATRCALGCSYYWGDGAQFIMAMSVRPMGCNFPALFEQPVEEPSQAVPLQSVVVSHFLIRSSTPCGASLRWASEVATFCCPQMWTGRRAFHARARTRSATVW